MSTHTHTHARASVRSQHLRRCPSIEHTYKPSSSAAPGLISGPPSKFTANDMACTPESAASACRTLRSLQFQLASYLLAICPERWRLLQIRIQTGVIVESQSIVQLIRMTTKCSLLGYECCACIDSMSKRKQSNNERTSRGSSMCVIRSEWVLFTLATSWCAIASPLNAPIYTSSATAIEWTALRIWCALRLFDCRCRISRPNRR